MHGICDYCRNEDALFAFKRGFHGQELHLCDACGTDFEREEGEAQEAEYLDRSYDLAREYGYDAPWV